MQEANVWFSFLTSLHFVGITLDLLGALLIVYFGLWPALNIGNTHYNEDDFRKKRRLCCRNATIGLLFVIAGFSLQLADIANKYKQTLCC